SSNRTSPVTAARNALSSRRTSTMGSRFSVIGIFLALPSRPDRRGSLASLEAHVTLRRIALDNARVAAGVLVCAGIALLQGCASFTPQTEALAEGWPEGLPRAHELTEVPFFPQSDYQCGPAALATVMVAAGVKVTPEELVPEVYLPE